MSKVCFYHGSDLDGLCSAAIVKYAHPEVILYPMEYNQPSHDVTGLVDRGDEVFVVDFTLQPFEEMAKLTMVSELVWIDHHQTTMADYDKFLIEKKIRPVKGSRIIGMSACELTWMYFYPETTIPYSVWLLGRYDVWDHQASETIMPFQYGMNLVYEQPENTEFWGSIFNSQRDSELIQGIIRDGRTIIKYRDKLNKKICEYQMFESKLMDYNCICVNRALCGSSVFDSVWDPEKYDMMAVFYVCARGAWNVSLYTTRPEINVGEIAKLYGGGGHAGAAGFKCSLLPFEVID